MCQWKSRTPTGLVGRYWKGKRYGTLVVSGTFLSVDLCEEFVLGNGDPCRRRVAKSSSVEARGHESVTQAPSP